MAVMQRANPWARAASSRREGFRSSADGRGPGCGDAISPRLFGRSSPSTRTPRYRPRASLEINWRTDDDRPRRYRRKRAAARTAAPDDGAVPVPARKHIAPLLGGRRLADFDDNPALIRSWRSALLVSEVSASSTANAYRLLRAVLATAVDDDLIRRNPCRLRKAGAEAAAERPTLSAGQVAALADRVPPRCSALILLTTYASLRWVRRSRCSGGISTSTRGPSECGIPTRSCPRPDRAGATEVPGRPAGGGVPAIAGAAAAGPRRGIRRAG